MVDFLPAAQQYSYNFDGNAQTLDHIILNHKAFVFLTRFAYARDDSDFAVKNYESTNELRISDHDQPVAYFNLTLSPTASSGVVSGRVTDTNGAPVPGSVVQLSGAQTRKTITDAGGNYHFDNVETSSFYTVTPVRANYVFSPASRSFSQVGNRTEAAFTGSANGDTTNPSTPRSILYASSMSTCSDASLTKVALTIGAIRSIGVATTWVALTRRDEPSRLRSSASRNSRLPVRSSTTFTPGRSDGGRRSSNTRLTGSK